MLCKTRPPRDVLCQRTERSLHSDAWVSRGRVSPVLTAGAALLVTRVAVSGCADKDHPRPYPLLCSNVQVKSERFLFPFHPVAGQRLSCEAAVELKLLLEASP